MSLYSQVYGKFRLLDEANDAVFAFAREMENHRAVALVVLNFSDERVRFVVDADFVNAGATLATSNYSDVEIGKRVESEIILNAFEGRIYLASRSLN